MHSFCSHIHNEDGFVLIVALFVLILLTIIGISATNTTVIDIQISQNDKASKIAFYNADGGIYPTVKLISQTINAGAKIEVPNLGTIIYRDRPAGEDPSTDFFSQVMGYDDYDGGGKDIATDIEFNIGVNTVQVDVQRTGQETLVGGGAEFASGAEGIGGGSSVAAFFAVDSFGSGPSSASSNVGANYRKVVGVPGGL